MFGESTHRRIAWAVLAVLVLSASVPAAGPPASNAREPRDQVLRFVPADVGFCLVVQDLRQHLEDLAGSPFYQKWLKSPHGAALASAPEWKQLQSLDQRLMRDLGVGLVGLRNDVFGETLVCAYRPGPPGKPEEEQGLFLLRARNEKLLADLLQKINEVQKKTGELKDLRKCEHRGVKYLCREEPARKTYYLLRGPVLLFTAQEAFLRQAIDRDLDEPAGAIPPLSRRLREMRLDDALLALVINPRAWDAELLTKAADPGAKTFAACWKALDGVALAVHLDREVRFSLTVKAKTGDLPASIKRFLTSATSPSATWTEFPENALVAAGGRLDLPALYEVLGLFMSKTSQREMEAKLDRTLGVLLGRSVVKEVLPALGPDWGLCVTAPATDSKQWMPGVVFAVRVDEGNGSDPVDQAILLAVLNRVQLVILNYNILNPEQPLALRTQTLDRVRVRSVQGSIFPVGVQPAFALKTGFLILASAPAEILRFKASTTAAGAGPMPLVRVSVKDWRAYLKDRREPLATALANRDGIKKNQALAKIDELRQGLELIDRVELRQQAWGGMVSFTLAIQPSAALQK